MCFRNTSSHDDSKSPDSGTSLGSLSTVHQKRRPQTAQTVTKEVNAGLRLGKGQALFLLPHISIDDDRENDDNTHDTAEYVIRNTHQHKPLLEHTQ